ncbi:DUF4282 domain-containing protein [Parenemella sanctibonifatiensis]|uniref:DUF4282 domain-containing protein n=1 Tax=Parenemella sanctibonifatiensis TaxID=2016505 RepID=A0A255DXX3_9ACTN|nr:DUF4282 domain-containing protein [Parenemella sanctibonifatiensis]OYN84124.1 hypothetical protein CGZ92_13865 [Parenemella sanctibonifatiensis]
MGPRSQDNFGQSGYGQGGYDQNQNQGQNPGGYSPNPGQGSYGQPSASGFESASQYPSSAASASYPSDQGGYGQQPAPSSNPYAASMYNSPVGGEDDDLDENPFTAMFDFSFQKFATPSLIKIAYILWIVLSALGALSYVGIIFIGMAVNDQAGLGILLSLLALVGFAIGFFLYTALIRMSLEALIATVRTAQEVRKIRIKLEG